MTRQVVVTSQQSLIESYETSIIVQFPVKVLETSFHTNGRVLPLDISPPIATMASGSPLHVSTMAFATSTKHGGQLRGG
ncbi:hypothetical protein AAC387_Pa08g2389 [Persea americana]